MTTSAYVLLASGRGHRNPLHGQLFTKNGLIHDSTGPRRVMGWSDFCLQRLQADDPAEVRRSLDSGVKADRHCVRIALTGPSESEDFYGGYWRGRIASPEMVKETLIPTLRQLDQRELYAHLFGSYNFGYRPGMTSDEARNVSDWPKEEAFHQWAAATIRKEGLGKRIALFEWFNEWNLTSPYGGGWNEDTQIFGSPDTYQHAAAAIAIWKRELGCLCTMGSPGEEDKSIAETITRAGGDIAAIDFGRGYAGDLMMKHADRGAYDGRYHGRYKGAGLWVTEPAGPDSVAPPHDSFDPLNDPAYLFGMHAIYALTGQAVSFFSGPSVRHHQPIDSVVGFYEHPALMQFLPENVAQWNGWTWLTNPDNPSQFACVAAEEWHLLDHAPRSIKHWQALFCDETMRAGSGPIVVLPNTGWKACILKGEWM